MEKTSWACTLATQLSLCFALFIAFKMGHPPQATYHNRMGANSNGITTPLDLYFISVRGGFRPLKHQTHLLKQMEKVVKTYNVKFVVNISELGEKDPLTQNATWYFRSLKVPWYTTQASNGQGEGCFSKQIEIANGKTLVIIGLDTGSSQDPSGGIEDHQLNWLMRTLQATNSDWRIIVGFHPLNSCEKNEEQVVTNQTYEPLHRTFLKLGVNLYLSGLGCIRYAHQGSIAYLGNPGLTDFREMINGIFLHRVSSLEIGTYFVNSAGEVVHRHVLQQRGKAAM